MLTHGNLVWNTMQSAAWFPGLRDGAESVMCVLPFFHSYGMTVCMNLGILKAAKLVLMPRFDLKRTLKAVQKEKADAVPRRAAPLRLDQRVAGDAEVRPALDHRVPVAGPRRCPPAVAEKFEQITGGNLVEGYGLTETSPVTHANPSSGGAGRGRSGCRSPTRTAAWSSWATGPGGGCRASRAS